MYLINSRKKYLIFGCIALILLMIFSALVSCEQDLDDMDYPDEKLIKRIENAYNEKHCPNDPQFFVEECYGIYNGCIPVMMGGGFYFDIVITETVAGIDFIYADGRAIEVWRDGEFYSLTEAYDHGYLNKDDLSQIKERDISLSAPDKKQLEDIERQYQAEVNDEMHIAHCFGVYNGCVLIMFEGGFWPDMGTTLEIEDFKFYFPTPNVMQAWRAGDFLPLDEAYNEGWLTHENIADIHKQYQDYQKSK